MSKETQDLVIYVCLWVMAITNTINVVFLFLNRRNRR